MYFEKRRSVKYFGIRKRVESDKYLEMEVGSHKKKLPKEAVHWKFAAIELLSNELR